MGSGSPRTLGRRPRSFRQPIEGSQGPLDVSADPLSGPQTLSSQGRSEDDGRAAPQHTHSEGTRDGGHPVTSDPRRDMMNTEAWTRGPKGTPGDCPDGGGTAAVSLM